MFAKVALLTAVTMFTNAVMAGRGDLTYFTPALGACGWWNSEADPVVALSQGDWAGGSHCGQWITITKDGKTTAGQIVDLCMGCATGDIDVSPVIFDDIVPLSVGREHEVDWWFQ